MKARKKKQAGRKPNGGGPRIIDKTHEPPIQTGIYAGTGGDRIPGELDPKTPLEASRHEWVLRRVAPHMKLACPPDPEPPSVAELMAYLQPFWYGPYEAEMWGQFRLWTRPSYRDLRLIEADADRAGMTARDRIFTLALRAIKKYVAKQPHLLAVLATAGGKPDSAERAVGPEAGMTLTLVEFMELCCVEMREGLRRRRSTSLTKAARRGAVELPPCAGEHRSGQAKRYDAQALMRAWGKYRDYLPDLPPLKDA